jgi:hypothetical protein
MKKVMDPYRIVLRRPRMSPTFPTSNEATRAPTSRIATTVPMVARDG